MTTFLGLVTFEEIKKACILLYKEYFIYEQELDAEEGDEEFEGVENMEQLIDVLYGLGFKDNEAYKFIFDAIIIQK